MRYALFLFLFARLASRGLQAAEPANDDFANATEIPPAGLTDVVVTNAGATPQKGEPRASQYSAGETVWYSYTAPADGTLLLVQSSLATGTFDPTLNVVTGKALGKLQLVPVQIPPVSEDYRRQFFAFPVRAGQKYHLQFDGTKYQSSTGTDTVYHLNFHLAVRFSSAGFFRFVDSPPARGERVHTYLEGKDSTITLTVGRLGSTEGTASVKYSLDPLPRFTGQLSGTLTFGPGETRKSFTVGLANNGTKEAPAFPAATLFDPQGGAALLDERIELDIEDDDNRPSNDDFAQAQAISGSGAITSPVAVATNQYGELGGNRSIWYRYTPTADGVLLLDAPNYPTNYSGSRVYPSVFTGTTLENLRYYPLVSDNYTENQTRYPVRQGEPFYLQVANVTNNYGSIAPTLNYTFSTDSAVTFDPEFYQATKTASKASIVHVTLVRQGAASAPATVTYTLTPGQNVKPGVDYKVPATNNVQFAAGSRTAGFDIEILRHKRKAPYASVDVSLASTSASVVTGYQATVSLYNAAAGNEDYYVAASYAAELKPATGAAVSGFLTVQISAKGALTGKVLYGGASHPFKGKVAGGYFAEDDSRSVTIDLPEKGRTLTLTLAAPDAESSYYPVLNAVLKQDGAILATADGATALRATFGKLTPGMYTIRLEAGAGVPESLATPGSASLRLDAKGKVKLVGTLADGTKFSAGGVVTSQTATYYSDNGSLVFPLAVLLDHGRNLLAGHIGLSGLVDRAPAVDGDGSGSLTWVHSATNTVPTAFTGTLDPFVSHYLVPAGELVLSGQPPAIGQLGIAHGEDVTLYSFTLAAGNKVSFDADLLHPPKLTFSASTGLFSGSVDAHTPFAGVILRNLGQGDGSVQRADDEGVVHAGAVTLKILAK